MTEPVPAAGKAGRQAAFGFIFASALMNSTSFGLMIPILPNLLKQFTGGDTAAASEWNTYFAFVWGLMQLFVGPILGVLSDRVGRRPILLISNFGLAVDFLFMAFAPNLAWLFVGRVLNGMTAASFSTGGAYVADITSPKDRAKNFGMLTSAFSMGFLLGPTLGGFLGEINLRLPFLVAAGLTALNWLYGLLILPESLPPERRLARYDWKRANPFGALQLLRSHPGLLSLAGVGFLFQLAQIVLPQIFVLYTTWRYHWSLAMLGLTFPLTGILGVIVQMGLVGPAVKRLGERGALLIGLASSAAGMMIYAFAPTGPIFYLGVVVGALSGLMSPGLQGLMTRRVGPSEQGQLQGANSAMMGVAANAGPALYLSLLAFAVRNKATLGLPGLPILVSSLLCLVALAVAWPAARPAPEHEPSAA